MSGLEPIRRQIDMIDAPKLVDMARTSEEVANDCMPCSPGESNRYPYGLCISLGNAELEKLGADIDGIEVGDMVHLFALSRVTCVSKNNTGDGEKTRVELQICYLGTELEDDEDAQTDKPIKKPKSATASAMIGRMYKGG